MARIEIYSNDSNVTLDDKVIGTDALDNSTKNFTVGDMIALVPPYTAGTSISIANNVISWIPYTPGTNISIANNVISSIPYTAGTNISIANNVVSCTLVNTDTIDYISNVSLVGSELRFTGIGNGFTGNVDIGGLIQPDTSYLGNVALNGNILEFTGAGTAFTGAIDLSQFLDNTDTNDIDYISTLTLSNGVITYTGVGNAPSGSMDIKADLASTFSNQEIFVARVDATLPLDPTPQALPLSSAGTNVNLNSVTFHPQGKLTKVGDTVQNTAGADSTLKITMHGFVRALHNNQEISYTLQTSNDNVNWANVKTVSRTKSSSAQYSDMFGAYFTLADNHYFRVVCSSSTGDIEIEAGSQIEFIVM
jgi:hypothetical protein